MKGLEYSWVGLPLATSLPVVWVHAQDHSDLEPRGAPAILARGYFLLRLTLPEGENKLLIPIRKMTWANEGKLIAQR